MGERKTGHNAQIALGIYGEELAARHLVTMGMRIVDRNWRTRAGEIDLVALERDELVVVEVKTRSDEQFGGPLVAVDHRKLARLRRLANEWAASHELRYSGIRIDVVAIVCPRNGSASLQHVRGVE